MGIANVNGRTEKDSPSSSPYNTIEAQAIARWVSDNKSSLTEFKSGSKALCDVIAIITPFKKQIECINHALKAYSNLNGENITVGTTHTLQGAERNIILFSAVQADDGSHQFIDQKPNLLNVAVSRAKDNFILFCDMKLLAKSRKGAPSGKLYQYIKEQGIPYEILPTIEYKDILSSDTNRISTLEKHVSFLDSIFSDANTGENITIISPFVRISAVKHGNTLNAIKQAVQRSVKVQIIIGRDERIDQMSALKLLACTGAEVLVIDNIHSKAITVRKRIFAEGSFNWFSASRDKGSMYSNYESTFIYTGDKVEIYIKYIKDDLAKLFRSGKRKWKRIKCD